ncbi:hypothetical protein K440DRAFT_539484 [Wilcoxina mikolae CBS 423.85]|nr:hypothetical protein K440DRAFT_539484 [Wilcoxina mikolae CBS 423.85]
MAYTFQESLPDRSTVVPVILGFNKIMLSIFSGDNSAWPVYLSISNLPKVKQRSVKSNGLILIELLPRCPNGPIIHTMKIAYQESMAAILRPYEEPVKSGIKVLCTDSLSCHTYLRIASSRRLPRAM